MKSIIKIEDELIRLEQAALSHRDAAEEMKQEFFDNNENVINGSALYDQMSFDKWLENTDRNHNPETVRGDWAVATTFFAIRQSDDKLLGMIDVRHELTVPFLQEYGGHIGYAVRPSERRKGYATRMLKLALSYCRSIGIPAVRLGCYTDNKASIRTIEHCGGVCIEEKPYLDGKPMSVYQILNLKEIYVEDAMDSFVDERDYKILENDKYTFFVLGRIMDGKCELLLTDHERLIICFTKKPYPVWIWISDDAAERDMERAYQLAAEHCLLDGEHRLNLKYE